jgi:putative ABC transport system permease protein
MVGVGFYAGIQMTAPNVIAVADSYYTDHKLMDFRIVSSMGLTDDDVNMLKQLDYVCDVVPSYSLDVQSKGGNTIRIHAIEETVNTVKLTEGQMPNLDTECVADSRSYKIGDKIEVTTDVDDKIKNTEFTVVGLIESVLYLAEDYGSTTVGNGKLSSFMFINKNNFSLDVYIEIYIIVAKTDNDIIAYSDGYKALTLKLEDELNRIKHDRENARYYEIYNEAKKLVEEKENELKIEKVKAEKEFYDAKNELDENAQKIQKAKNEIAEKEAELADTVKTQNVEFDVAKQKVADGWEEINFALSQAGITQEEIGSKIDELHLAINSMEIQLGSLPVGSFEYIVLNATIEQYLEVLWGIEQLKSAMDTLGEQEKQLNDGIAVFNAEIENAKKAIENAKNELATNEKKLNAGYKEYYDNLEKFDAEIADAVKKIEEAKSDLSTMEQPVWYISDRKAAVGYDELESSIQIVAIIATVFPLFFILISMLMTSNSMARMITEERSELGTLTSLGYNDKNIISTYILYVLSASGLGATIGFFIGCRVIPPLIWYNFVYILPPLILQYNMRTFGIILAITFALMSFVTIVTCNRELKQKPATLLRPLPPKQGQQIVFEKITFIWKRLSFTWKITIRNMFRYKKRAFMTIVGVAGCAALLLVAFGVYDGMNGIAQKQYGDIMRYDNMIILKNETQTIDNELKMLLDRQQVIEPLLIKQSACKVEINQKLLDTFLIVPQNDTLFEKYFNLKSTLNEKDIVLNDGDVIITQRIATVYKLKNGDIITIKDTDNNHYNLTVTDVAENYITNYIYINAPTYEELTGNSVTFNIIVSNNNNAEKTNLAENLIDSGFAINVFFSKDTVENAKDTVNRLNGVIILVLVVASILAIVVLYNLTAINISERTREIATLKVLGFRDSETNAYIYREAFILTAISIIIGMILGIILHNFVLELIEINAISLYKNIKATSFIISCTITIAISILMQTITYFKLKKINMIESLKNIE